MSWIKKLLGIEEILEEVKKNREEIPNEVWAEYEEVQGITSKPIPRKILKRIEEFEGRVNITKLRNELETSDVCSKPTFYKYIKKLEQRGVIQRVKEGKKVYVISSSQTFLNVSK